MDEGAQKVQTSSYKSFSSGKVVYSMVTVVKTVLYIQKLLRE